MHRTAQPGLTRRSLHTKLTRAGAAVTTEVLLWRTDPTLAVTAGITEVFWDSELLCEDTLEGNYWTPPTQGELQEASCEATNVSERTAEDFLKRRQPAAHYWTLEALD